MAKENIKIQEFYQEKGYLDVIDNPKFRIILDASKCLRQKKTPIRCGFFESDQYPGYAMWFPNFIEKNQFLNKRFANTLSDRAVKIKEYNNSIINPPLRIVFPKLKDENGVEAFTFFGVYKMDLEKTTYNGGRIYNRLDTKFILGLNRPVIE